MSKILIIDDDRAATNMLEQLLKIFGYETNSVNDSSKAMGVVASVNPDLILLDLMMPEVSGMEICKMLQTDPSLAHIPVIIVSALDDGDTKAEAYQAGAKDYIAKPYHPDDLLERMNALINKAATS